jgi:osmotically-inducible protein OsmY
MNGGMSVELWLAERDDAARQGELLQRVWDELAWQVTLDACDLSVSVSGRTVTLSGTVPSYPEKIVAEHAVKRVPGVQLVTNQVLVSPPAADARTDQELGEAVRHALQWDVAVPSVQIRTAIADGCVTLEGEVPRDSERTAAERAVSYLRGVRAVVNRLTVPVASRPRDFEARVRRALSRDPDLRGDKIRVTARGGRVLLRGRVRCLAEREEAEHDVRAVAGVEAVQDEVAVD